MTDQKKNNEDLSLQSCSVLCGAMGAIIQNPDNAKQEMTDLLIEEVQLLGNEIGSSVQVSSFSLDEEFQRDFARIFYGVGDETLSLTGSFWLQPDLKMRQIKAQEVSEKYWKFGIKNTTSLPDDHLAVEMGFVQELINRGEYQAAIEFLDQHVLSWIPYLKLSVEKMSNSKDLVLFTNLMCQIPKLIRVRLQKENQLSRLTLIQ